MMQTELCKTQKPLNMQMIPLSLPNLVNKNYVKHQKYDVNNLSFLFCDNELIMNLKKENQRRCFLEHQSDYISVIEDS